MTTTPQPVFDGHNDVLLHLWRAGDAEGQAFFDGRPGGHLDLARCRAGGFAGGLFAVYVPGRRSRGDTLRPDPDAALPDPVEPGDARRDMLEIAATLMRMTRARGDALRLCRSVGEIEAARAAGAIAAVMHLEGCEGIGPDLAELEVLHAAGLRSLGPVWSRSNIFGTGVPFRFPADPDIGPGLTGAGRRLLRRCEELGILVDLSHINAAGFRDVAALSSRPLVASHSNLHAIAPSARNLVDWQLDAIRESGGLVGVNFAVGFLRPDGRADPDTPLSVMVDHIARLVDRLGEGGVALGSDFDGAVIPRAIGDAAGLPALLDALRAAGFGEALVARIAWGNWIGLLRRVIG
ncbi:MAG: membrane dipeptidase [Alphaproteobacteria bacterium]|nr:MAG: membrane dipeptidase [Alphaproteobacteria bacterium]